MSAECCHAPQPHQNGDDPRYIRVLWLVLAINAALFVFEIVLGLAAKSVALQADSLDFFGDAVNYGLSLAVAGLALHQRARAVLFKGISMGLFGLWVVGSAIWHLAQGTVPEAFTMGWVGIVALVANALSFGLLWAYRSGDSNMRSVWLCSRNDVIGNVAVLLAAIGVFGTSRGWPDVVVAVIMGALATQGSWVVTKTASREMAETGA
ncbi:MAG: cation transporter [Acidobacteriota bacterium]